MKKKIIMSNSENKENLIAEVLKRNLFTLSDGTWTYTSDSGELVMSISYTVSKNEIEFDVWMINEDLKILFDKILEELKL